MKKTGKLISMLLAFTLIVSMLSGCGGNQASEDSGGSGNGSDSAAGVGDTVYVASYIPVEGEYTSPFNACVYADGSFYVSASEVVDDRTPEGVTPDYEGQYWVYGTGLYKVSVDGSVERIPYQAPTIPEGQDGSVSTDNIAVTSDGTIYLLERTYIYWFDAPEGVTEEDDSYWDYYQNEEKYEIKIIGSDGSVISSIDLSSLSGAAQSEYGFYVSGFEADDEGNIYLTADQTVYVLDGSGSVLFTCETSGWVERVLKLADGSVGIAYYSDSGRQVFALVDLQKEALGAEIPVQGELYNMSAGGGDYDFYYTSGINFFGYKLESGEEAKLLNWISCDINPDYANKALVLDDGRIATFTYEYSDDYTNCTNELAILVPTPADQVPQKETLTLAAVYMDSNVRSQVIDFNKKNEKYRIEVLDYSEYNTDEDYSAGLTKLKTEIMSGNMPDMMTLNELPVAQLAAKGLLEDLYPLIDSDPEMSREDFMESVLSAFEIDGKLYGTYPSFGLFTIVGASSVVGDTPGWTTDDFQKALASMPEGCEAFDETMTRDQMLQICLYLDMDQYVNWNTGECNFDSEGFVKLLEFVNSFHADFDWENYDWSAADDEFTRISEGRQMLTMAILYDFDTIQMNEAMFGGQPITYIGFPTSEGTGNMFMNDGSSFGLSSKCANKEAAWEFLRQFYTEEYQDGNYMIQFPTNKTAFNKKLEEAMTPEYEKDADGNYLLDENGERIEVSQGGYGYGDLSIEVYALTQAQADQFLQLLETTTKVQRYDESLNEIVIEGAAPYFAGERSAEDVAKQIQSKASIYVNEQR